MHLPPALLQPLLGASVGPRPSGVLLRADLAADRALLALVVRDLLGPRPRRRRPQARLSWVAERRALFGALRAGRGRRPAGAAYSESFCLHQCYVEQR